MGTDYSNVTKDQISKILNDFYNYVLDEHDCILRNEQIDLFLNKDCVHPLSERYADDGNIYCGICHKEI